MFYINEEPWIYLYWCVSSPWTLSYYLRLIVWFIVIHLLHQNIILRNQPPFTWSPRFSKTPLLRGFWHLKCRGGNWQFRHGTACSTDVRKMGHLSSVPFFPSPLCTCTSMLGGHPSGRGPPRVSSPLVVQCSAVQLSSSHRHARSVRLTGGTPLKHCFTTRPHAAVLYGPAYQQVYCWALNFMP